MSCRGTFLLSKLSGERLSCSRDFPRGVVMFSRKDASAWEADDGLPAQVTLSQSDSGGSAKVILESLAEEHSLVGWS